jgi:hypothetical protein
VEEAPNSFAVSYARIPYAHKDLGCVPIKRLNRYARENNKGFLPSMAGKTAIFYNCLLAGRELTRQPDEKSHFHEMKSAIYVS